MARRRNDHSRGSTGTQLLVVCPKRKISKGSEENPAVQGGQKESDIVARNTWIKAGGIRYRANEG